MNDRMKPEAKALLDLIATFARITPDVWVPRRLEIRGTITLIAAKRSILSTNIISNCRLDMGFDDAILE